MKRFASLDEMIEREFVSIEYVAEIVGHLQDFFEAELEHQPPERLGVPLAVDLAIGRR